MSKISIRQRMREEEKPALKYTTFLCPVVGKILVKFCETEVLF